MPNTLIKGGSSRHGKKSPTGLQGIDVQHTNPLKTLGEFTSRICQGLPDTNAYQLLWHKALKARAKVAIAEVALRGYQRIQRQNLKQALETYLAALIEQAPTVSVDWWEKLKPLRIGTKGKKVLQYLQPIPEIIYEYGMPFATATKAADGWVKSFAVIEGGTFTTAAQIVDIVLREAANNLADQFSGPITDIISRRQVEEALRKTKSGSAPGPDGITVDFLQRMRTW